MIAPLPVVPKVRIPRRSSERRTPWVFERSRRETARSSGSCCEPASDSIAFLLWLSHQATSSTFLGPCRNRPRLVASRLLQPGSSDQNTPQRCQIGSLNNSRSLVAAPAHELMARSGTDSPPRRRFASAGQPTSAARTRPARSSTGSLGLQPLANRGCQAAR